MGYGAFALGKPAGIPPVVSKKTQKDDCQSWPKRKKALPLRRFSAEPLAGCRVPCECSAGAINNLTIY